MLAFFSQKHRSTNDSEAQSSLFDEKTFYPAFLKDIGEAKSEVIIESPFITKRRSQILLPSIRHVLKRKVAVIINTRSPMEHSDVMRSEAELSVALLQELGAEVFYTGKLHRKLAIIDREIMWEGSLNILSQYDSCELMRRTRSAAMSQLTLRYIARNSCGR